MPPHHFWTAFLLLIFFTIASRGYNHYENDTSFEIFNAQDLAVRAGPGPVTGGNTMHKLRIVVVGDVHGDFEALLTILKYLEVVDQSGKWSGKVDVFVQLGDVIDRGPDTKKLFGFLDKLRDDAHKNKGRVYTLLGNHEVENLMYHWDYVSTEELSTFGFFNREANRRQQLSSGSIGESLANNYLAGLLLPLYPPDKPVNTPYDGKVSQFSHSAIAFVHGGLCPTFYEQHLFPFPTSINNIAKGLIDDLRKWLQKNDLGVPYKQERLTPMQKLFYDRIWGPLWYRGLAEKPKCEDVEKMLKAIGARRIIVGHTPNVKGIVKKCGGKIIVTDTKITRWEQGAPYLPLRPSPIKYHWVKGKSGMLSALNIQYTFDGKTQREWIHAVYPDLIKSRDTVELVDESW